MKSVLMVAFHFPPQAGSSGVQRTLRFAQHLPRFGWQPLVLTAHPMAYTATRGDLLHDIPPGMVVERAIAFDCARHFSLFGRYPGALARPDRWASWRFDALRRADSLIETHRPRLIWSTYPISTAHLIAAQVARRHGLPWVADFRDPMAQTGYPADPKTWAQWAKIEHTALKDAAATVFVAPGARRFYEARYPTLDARRWQVIENGYDEDSFTPCEARAPLDDTRLTLLHSGLIYPSERDPRPLFEALATLPRDFTPRFVLRLRACGDAAWANALIERYGVGHFVHTAPALEYREALREMQRADALVVMQAANCNDQIPAKVYEYLRADRPMLGLVDAAGDTAQWMARIHAPSAPMLANPADPAALAAALMRFVRSLAADTAPLPTPDAVAGASRLARSRALAQLFDRLEGPST